MENNNELSDEQFWKGKIKQHWKAFMVLIIAGACMMIGAIIVFIWFMNISPIGNFGQYSIDFWTLNDVVLFMIFSFLWELLFLSR